MAKLNSNLLVLLVSYALLSGAAVSTSLAGFSAAENGHIPEHAGYFVAIFSAAYFGLIGVIMTKNMTTDI